MSLRDLVHRMVTVSGNLATNLVLDEVGTQEVAAVLADAGLLRADDDRAWHRGLPRP